MKLIDTLKKLCLLNGTSGREDNVRNYLVDIIKNIPSCEYYVDALGNLIVEKHGKNRAKNKVLLDAHMDEVGFIITDITDSGFLKFDCVGGIDNSVLLSKRVTVNGLNGVIGSKPVHLLEKEEKNKYVDVKNLYIDIGVSSKEQAQSFVNIGDEAYFESEFFEFGDGFIKSKAIDDRLGCAILLRLLMSESEYDFVCSFSVQEEVGARGAAVICNRVKPDCAIVVETTTACDLENIEHHKQVCSLGAGAVISYMDRGTVYDSKLFKKAFEIAKENSIEVQTKTLVAGGNNSSSIQQSFTGVRVCAVSVPCRYLHSPACVVNKKDIDSTEKIVKKLLEYMCDD